MFVIVIYSVLWHMLCYFSIGGRLYEQYNVKLHYVQIRILSRSYLDTCLHEKSVLT